MFVTITEIDEGWLCEGRVRVHAPALDGSHRDPIKRVRRRGLRPLLVGRRDRQRRGAAARGTPAGVLRALSGSETMSRRTRWRSFVRQGADSHDAVLPEEVYGALDAYRLPLSAIADAQVVAVLGDVRFFFFFFFSSLRSVAYC